MEGDADCPHTDLALIVLLYFSSGPSRSRLYGIDNPMNVPSTDTLRLFFALWPDDAIRSALRELQAPMRGRTIPYPNLHLTLAFLGQQTAALLPDINEILAHLRPAPVVIKLDRVGYFTRKRIAWAGMHEIPDALLSLRTEVAQALSQRGIAFDDQQAFKPHVTLARDAALPPDMTFAPITWRADRVALVQSLTSAEGADYRVLASRSLDQACRVSGEAGGR